MDASARIHRPCETRRVCWLPLAAVLLSSSVLHADEVQLIRAKDFSTAFAGDDITVTFRVKAEQPVEGRLLWSHTAQQRTLSRGEADVRQSDDGPEASFELRLPEVRDGVIFQTQVAAEFVPRGRDSTAAKLQHSLWLFPRKPLAGRSTWASGLNLQLVDPDGRTSDALKSIDLPFQPLRSLRSALADGSTDEPGRNRVLLVGEGASLAKGTLIGAAVDAAMSGRRVIVLAPQEGTFFMPGFGDDDSQNIGEFRLARNSVITEFDKRLDAKAWLGSGESVPFRGLQMEAIRGRIQATVDDTGKGWPWLELRYPGSDGVLILCGFRIVEHWDNGPTPRYLLIRILESLSVADNE